jgi:hypothetical protein
LPRANPRRWRNVPSSSSTARGAATHRALNPGLSPIERNRRRSQQWHSPCIHWDDSFRTARPHLLRHPSCVISAQVFRATKISTKVNRQHRAQFPVERHANLTKRSAKISANSKKVSAARAGPAKRQSNAGATGLRHVVAEPADRAIIQHGVHGHQLESHGPSLHGAIAGFTERQYFRRAKGLRHQPAEFSAAATAAGNQPGPSPSSSRRGWRRPTKQPNLAGAQLSIRRPAIQQSLERPNCLRHLPARPATIRARRLQQRYERRHAILRGSRLPQRHRLTSRPFATQPSGESFVAVATTIVTRVALIRLDRR